MFVNCVIPKALVFCNSIFQLPRHEFVPMVILSTVCSSCCLFSKDSRILILLLICQLPNFLIACYLNAVNKSCFSQWNPISLPFDGCDEGLVGLAFIRSITFHLVICNRMMNNLLGPCRFSYEIYHFSCEH